MSTIETTFLVIDRGTPAVRGLRAEVRGLREDAEGAGLALDRMAGSEDASKMQELASGIKGVRREALGATTSLREYSSALDTTARRTKTLIRDTERLGVALERVGAIRARPHLEVTGVEESMARVQALKAEIASLNGTSRVNISAASSGGLGGGRRGLFSGRNLLLGSALALPGAQALIGGATGIVGSAGAAGLGAGAVGGSGLGVLAAGLGAFVAISKPGTKALDTAAKATDTYTAALRDYGVGSSQAKAAKEDLDRSFANNPGLHQAIKDQREFNREWALASRNAKAQYFGMRGDIARAGSRDSAALGAASTTATTAVRAAVKSQLDFLTSPEPTRDLQTLVDAFANDLPFVEHSLQNVEKAVLRIAVASLPYVHELNVAVEQTTRGWATGTRDADKLDKSIGHLVDDTKDWGHLLGDGLKLIKDIGQAGRPSGSSMVRDLDGTLKRWDKWVKDDPGQVREFFDQTADNTVKIAGALGDATHWLNQMATELQPIVAGFTSIVGAAGSLGLGAPGSLALLLGARAGWRGAAGAGAGAAASGGIGAGTAALAGAGVAATGLAGAGAFSRARLIGSATYAGSRAGGFGRVQALGVSARSLRAAGVGSRFGAAASGAGKRFLPIGIGLSALSAYGFDGPLDDKIQAGLSSFSLGAVARPTTAGQRMDRSQAVTNAFLAKNVDTLGDSYGAGLGKQGRVTAEIDRLQARLNEPRRHEIGDATGVGIALDFGSDGTLKKERQGLTQRIKLLKDEQDQLEKTNKANRTALDARHVAESEARGSSYASKIGGIYDAYAGHMNSTQAATRTTADITRRIGGSHAPGAEIVGEEALGWAKAMAKENPALQSQVAKITSAIRAKFKDLGTDVHIINGNILTGSASEWAGIGQAITDPIEQAKEAAHKGFTGIQQEAIGSLMSMGYSKSSASQFIRDVQKGRVDGSNPTAALGGTSASQTAGNKLNHRGGAKRARGGRLPGVGLQDTVPMADGGWGAPGELVVNRHTEGKVDAILGMFGTRLGDLVGREATPHYAPMRATGGRIDHRGVRGGFAPAAGTDFSQGSEPRIAADLAKLGRLLHTTVLGISGYRTPAHSVAVGGFPNDPHTRGEAADIGVPGGFLSSGRADRMLRSVGLYRPFYPASAKEINHVQLLAGGASGGGVGAGAGAANGSLGVAAQMIDALHAPSSGLGGFPGAAADAATKMYAAALTGKLNKKLGASGAGGGATASGGVAAPAQVKSWIAAGLRLAGLYSPANAARQLRLTMGESGGNPTIRQQIHDINSTNGSGGAIGFAQMLQSTFDANALPGHHNILNPVDNTAASAIYQMKRYGHLVGHPGYAHGGRLGPAWGGWHKDGLDATFDKPTLIGVGEAGRERVKVVPERQHGGGAGGAQVVFQKGAFHLTVGGGVNHDSVLKIVEPLFMEFSEKVAAGLAGATTETARDLMA